MAIDFKIKDYQKINKIRTPIHDNKQREPEVIFSRSAVFQAPRLSVLQNLNKLNNNNNSNTNNNTGFSLRVPQIPLNGSKTVRITTFCSFLIIHLRKVVQEYLAMIRQFVKIFPKTEKLVRTGPSLRIQIQIRTQTVLTYSKRPWKTSKKMKSKDLILNLFKVGGKIQAFQVQMKIKSFLLGELVDANLF